MRNRGISLFCMGLLLRFIDLAGHSGRIHHMPGNQRMKRRLWWLTVCLAAGLVVITFTPLVTPAGRHTPSLLGFPYTLWTGIGVSVGLVLLTALAAILHRDSMKD